MIELSHLNPNYKASRNVAVVIPAYNEEKNIESVIKNCYKNSIKNIIVIDDYSTDKTYNIASKICDVIRNGERLGKQGTVKLGLLRMIRNKVDCIALIDGDGQHNPDYIPRMASFIGNYNAVFGLRQKEAMPLQRKIANNIVDGIFRDLTNINFKDLLCGYRLYDINLSKYLAYNLEYLGGFNLELNSIKLLFKYAQNSSIKIGQYDIDCMYKKRSTKLRIKDRLNLLLNTFSISLDVNKYQNSTTKLK